MSKCECTMAIRVNGDGCRYCQPQEYINLLIEWLKDAREETDSVAEERNEIEEYSAELKKRIAEAEAIIQKLSDLELQTGSYLGVNWLGYETYNAPYFKVDEVKELISEADSFLEASGKGE